MLFFVEHIFPYVAAVVCFFGIAHKLRQWLAVPSPFPITIFPAPGGFTGQLLALLQEMLLFNSLYRHNRLLWLFSWTMHLALGLIIAGHIMGIYFLGEQFVISGMSTGKSLALSQSLGMAAGAAFVISLVSLSGRRLYDAVARATSDLSNYLELALLAGIALTGMGLRLTITATDLALIRAYIAGLLLFRPAAMPALPWFFWHFVLVNILVMYLPYAKLVHGLGGGIMRILLTESPPAYPTSIGRKPRSSFAAAAVPSRFTQPRSTILTR